MEEQACDSRTERRQKLEMNMNKNVKQFAGRPDESIVLSTFLSSIVYSKQHQYGSFFLSWLQVRCIL